jgi:hypothetical protein
MLRKGKRQIQFIKSLLAIAVLMIANLTFLPQTFAGTLTHAQVVELGGASGANPEIAADGQAFAIDFTAATGGATSVAINFNSTGTWATNSGVVNGTQSVATSYGGQNCTTLFSGQTTPTDLPTGTTLTAAGASNTVTVSAVSSLTLGTNYCVFLTSTTALTNPTAGIYPVVITAGSDSQTAAVNVLSTGANAYTVSGTVAPTFTLSLTPSTATLGTLSYSGVTTSSAVTTTIATNALTGWFVWADDSNAGLHSTQAGHTISSVAANTSVNMGAGGDVGSEDYALAVTPSTGNATAAAPYVATSSHGGGLATGTFYEIATGSGATASSTFTTNELADISTTTPAATDYSDVVTLIGAGSY